ncbi:hypothetical protein N7507_002458 [Penicillium longicatenatum]|nr:hypothetical protein N7507_002458 [Penicillium longicatenatum]
MSALTGESAGLEPLPGTTGAALATEAWFAVGVRGGVIAGLAVTPPSDTLLGSFLDRKTPGNDAVSKSASNSFNSRPNGGPSTMEIRLDPR